MGKGGAKGKGVPCPSTNAAERALLDGYRMGVAASGGRGSGPRDSNQNAWGKGTGERSGKAAGQANYKDADPTADERQ